MANLAAATSLGCAILYLFLVFVDRAKPADLKILKAVRCLYLYLVALFALAFAVLVERWLFFAEAQHVSILYYGAPVA